jgi:hypothetical protein
MIRNWFGSLTALLAATGLATAQAPLPVSTQLAKPARPLIQLPPTPGTEPAALMPPSIETITEEPKPLVPIPAQPDRVPAPLVPTPPAHPATPVSCDEAEPGPTDSRFWVQGEYLLWFYKRGHVPPTIGPVGPSLLTGPATGGILSLPPNAIVSRFGGNASGLDHDGRSGCRTGIGYWLDSVLVWGTDAEYFQLERGTFQAGAGSDAMGLPVIGLVFNSTDGRQTTLFFSEPGLAGGSVNVQGQSRLWGVEANVRRLGATFSDRLDWLVGFRRLPFDEGLDAHKASVTLSRPRWPWAD